MILLLISTYCCYFLVSYGVSCVIKDVNHSPVCANDQKLNKMAKVNRIKNEVPQISRNLKIRYKIQQSCIKLPEQFISLKKKIISTKKSFVKTVLFKSLSMWNIIWQDWKHILFVILWFSSISQNILHHSAIDRDQLIADVIEKHRWKIPISKSIFNTPIMAISRNNKKISMQDKHSKYQKDKNSFNNYTLTFRNMHFW